MIDFAPLVVIMSRVAEMIVRRGGTFDKPKALKVWSEAISMVQSVDCDSFEHNTFIPCRSSDQAFEPVVDEVLVTLFLEWYGRHVCPKSARDSPVPRLRRVTDCEAVG